MLVASTRMIRPAPKSRPGGVLFWLLLCLAVILGVTALTLDGGRMMEDRRRAQATADAAALAAGADLYAHYWSQHGKGPFTSAKAAAEKIAQANGFDPAAVTVNIPPKSGTFSGQAG